MIKINQQVGTNLMSQFQDSSLWELFQNWLIKCQIRESYSWENMMQMPKYMV